MEKEKYDLWREKLRLQLSETAKLFFISFSATIAFLLASYKDDLHCFIEDRCFIWGICLIITSAICYSLFTISRLIDYWMTQNLYGKDMTEIQVRNATRAIGWCTWILVGVEIVTFSVGFFLILFYIFSN